MAQLPSLGHDRPGRRQGPRKAAAPALLPPRDVSAGGRPVFPPFRAAQHTVLARPLHRHAGDASAPRPPLTDLPLRFEQATP